MKTSVDKTTTTSRCCRRDSFHTSFGSLGANVNVTMLLGAQLSLISGGLGDSTIQSVY